LPDRTGYIPDHAGEKRSAGFLIHENPVSEKSFEERKVMLRIYS
jgi:hypothetical protein